MSGGRQNNFDGQRWIENIIKERTREALERFPARERYLHYNQEYKRQEELYLWNTPGSSEFCRG